MLNFLEHRLEQLEEALITFGGTAYPKFNNVIIMAGGAGSGKGFIKSNLIGAEGRVFDVDALKGLAMKAPELNKKVKAEFGVEMSKLNLTKSDDVAKLHDIVSTMGIDDGDKNSVFNSVLAANPERRPNLIFDVTLKDLRKLEKISTSVERLGYDKKNIHIVWVVNDVEVAKKQNTNPDRGRVVPVEILVNTHRGVSATMQDIIKMGSKLKKYMDGDIVLAFNKIGVDADFKTSGRGGSYIEKANYVYIKKAGKQVTSLKDIDKNIKAKIKSYVPKNVEW